MTTPTPDHILLDVEQTNYEGGVPMYRSGCTCGYLAPFTPRPGASYRHARAHQAGHTTTVTPMKLAPAPPGVIVHANPATLAQARAALVALQTRLNAATVARNAIAREAADAADDRRSIIEERDELRRLVDVAQAHAQGTAYELGELVRVATGIEGMTWTDAIQAVRRLRADTARTKPLLDALAAWRYADDPDGGGVPLPDAEQALVEAFDEWTTR